FLSFADGSRTQADAVLGADGVHSAVREIMLGPEKPRFTGRVAYRTTFPAALLGDLRIDDCTKWWGPDRHIVMYYVKPRREEVYFVTSTPEPEFAVESWSAKGELSVLRGQAATSRPRALGSIANPAVPTARPRAPDRTAGTVRAAAEPR